VPHSADTTLLMKWSFEQPEAVKKVAGVFFVASSDRTGTVRSRCTVKRYRGRSFVMKIDPNRVHRITSMVQTMSPP
jgi:hypothetical protein